MAIDPSIALRYQPIQLPDPLSQYAKFAAIQSAQNQNALAQYQLGAAQRAEEETLGLKNYLAENAGASPEKLQSGLFRFGAPGLAFAKELSAQRNAELTREKTESELLSSEIDRASRAMANAPTIGAYRAIYNAIHDPKSRIGKYFATIGYDKAESEKEILNAENDPSGQLFAELKARADLKGQDLSRRILDVNEERRLAAAKPSPAITPAVATQPPVVESGQPMVGVQQYMPVSNALAPQVGGPDVQNAMVARAISSAAAPSTAQTPVSTNRFDSEITGLEQQIAAYENVPGEKARKLVDDLVKRRDNLVNQRRQQLADEETKLNHKAVLDEATRHNKALEGKEPEAVRAYEYAVKQGFKGTYADWVQSNQAKPADIQAYEYSLTQGFKGTLQDWMQSKQELPANVQEYEYARKQGYPGTYTQWVKENRAPGTNISIVNTPTAKSLSEPVGKLAETSLAKAQGAAESMESANQIRKALNAGNVIAGPLAGARTKFAQVLEMAGVGDKEKLANTRNAIQGLASMTLASRADLKGQGQITDMETKLLERAKSADIGDLTIGELHQIVNTAQKVSNRLWSNHQTLLKTMESDPEAASARKYYAPTGSIPEALGDQTSSKPDGRKPLANIFGQKK
jgi:hypothetical protein